MTKVDINIVKREDLTRLCLLCEREIGSSYYDINIEYEDDTVTSGRYRQLCSRCHCALNKHFTGRD